MFRKKNNAWLELHIQNRCYSWPIHTTIKFTRHPWHTISNPNLIEILSRVLDKKHTGRKTKETEASIFRVRFIYHMQRTHSNSHTTIPDHVQGATILEPYTPWIRLQIPAMISMPFYGNKEKPTTKSSRDLLILRQSMFRAWVGQGHGSGCVSVCHHHSFPRPESIQWDSYGQRVIHYDIDV